ncbi:MAG: hypothetical protein RLZZ592_1721 [Pseudomonadota bacterium]|jgi:soluble lytic murein transglycosylase
MKRQNLVRRGLPGAALALLASVTLPLLPAACTAQSASSLAQRAEGGAIVEMSASTRTAAMRALDDRLVQARDALRKRDRARLRAHRDALVEAGHPLALWADYWDMSLRLSELTAPEFAAFAARWPGSYVEDRLRNDWLLELGRRRDWRQFAVEHPRFRMNDDREVSCYALLLRQQAGEDVRAAARSAWFAQREGDGGCTLLAGTMLAARQFSAADVWLKARQAAEAKRPAAASQALTLLGEDPAVLTEILEQPLRFLAKKADAGTRPGIELTLMALARLAATDPAQAAAELQGRWQAQLPAEAQAWAWNAIARQAAMKLMPEADGWFRRAGLGEREVEWNDESLAWRVRAALRSDDPGRWVRISEAIGAMSPSAQADATWIYWRARAVQAGAEGEARRGAAAAMLERIAGQHHFYGQLAAEELGRAQSLPPRPAPLTAEERAQAVRHPGLDRAMAMIDLGLRSEGVREWNFSVREMSDRQLLAAAQHACDNALWDRCISTSERTRGEIDMAQRFPTPFREEVLTTAREVGVDPAYVYGLIRQESRFVTDARSGVGASGLMQVMPATARWTARRLGLPYSDAQITDRATNLKLGTGYLKLVLDDLGGSQALAAAGYNAGPNRPRRWREGPVMETAAWAENIPFTETRDYVKKVLSNASYYGALLAGRSQVLLKPRLQPAIGPRPADAVAESRSLP